ncbi:polysaccharide deacetylase family protein [Clostridium autoethanogenum]|uniref:Polysaccharide deacetylase family protein n=1 Tax=Clostridium autoethanogenum DSM 10061 TaxID=1341692 RepID=A0ABN4BKC7_9CLOT|nr:polysaccharide deacetylase family protein [Clostridium autoethanogenum]AGY78209.1 polysaccharide deacetylase family protein [Clostridium autoethanogenum DSM 10061]ALU38341.1 Polysaccharide deacetylase [Clostridium autoethanogenum DSM 10061]OVY51104.1 Peptidoglycan-N-acetylmuramic acid deacetylase PdaA precursor [Clostridium autoethanogenum]
MNKKSLIGHVNFIVHGNRESKQIALTYDCDDYDYMAVPQILYILRKNSVKATFFLTGMWVEKFPTLAMQIVIEGHQIGNHSYEHCHPEEMYYDESKKDIEKAEKVIEKITGVNPKPFFRAPYGEWSQYILKASNDCGYMYNVCWSIDPSDWKSPPTKTIVERVFKKLKGGDIVLMHGHGKNTAAASDFIISTLKSRKFEFKKISELI